MDYGRVLGRAWEITWRWKILWVLGFLAGLGGGFRLQLNYQYGTQEEVPPWLRDLWEWVSSPEAIPYLIGLGLLSLAVWIATVVVSIMARGGLVAGVQQVEEEGSTGFRQAWGIGRDRFWTLFGIAVLQALPFIAMFVLFFLFVLLAIGTEVISDRSMGMTFVPLLCCGIPTSVCGFVIVAIVLAQIRIYAENAAVLEGLGWIDAFKRGWQVLKKNLGPTVVLWFIFLGIGIGIGLVVAAVGMAVVGPFIIAHWDTDPASWPWVPIATVSVLLLLAGTWINSVWQTFSSATWTLAYRQFTGLAEPSPRYRGEPTGDPDADTQPIFDHTGRMIWPGRRE